MRRSPFSSSSNGLGAVILPPNAAVKGDSGAVGCCRERGGELVDQEPQLDAVIGQAHLLLHYRRHIGRSRSCTKRRREQVEVAGVKVGRGVEEVHPCWQRELNEARWGWCWRKEERWACCRGEEGDTKSLYTLRGEREW